MRSPLTLMVTTFPCKRSDAPFHSAVMSPSAPFPQTMVLADAVMVQFPSLLNHPSAPYHLATVLADARMIFQFPFPRKRPSASFHPATVLANARMVFQFLNIHPVCLSRVSPLHATVMLQPTFRTTTWPSNLEKLA